MTFSIIARDAQTGSLGVATATGGPVVGSLVPHARAGLGAIATQSTTNPFYAIDGLRLLEDGRRSAQEVLDTVVGADDGREIRQCIIVDRQGRTAAWTGAQCTPEAAARTRPNLAVAGNLLADSAVLDAMLVAYDAADGQLEDRLLAALAAGNAQGGDRRGIRSAALKVYADQPYPRVDLRADWSTAPIDELAAILAAVRAPDYADFFHGLPARSAT